MDISSSLGWLATYQPGDSFVVWESTDPSMDLLPGNSAQFSIASSLAPGLQPYGILGFDNATLDFAFNEAQILSPSPSASQIVPELSPLALLASALLPLAGAVVCKRRKA